MENFRLMPRGVGPTRWTEKDPPNYVKRSHALLGRTLDAGRVWDIIATVRYLRAHARGNVPVHVAGDGGAGVLAVCATLVESEADSNLEVTVFQPPQTLMDPAAPHFLNVLRVCDVRELLGMVAPHRLAIVGGSKELTARIATIYAAAGAREKLHIFPITKATGK
jgi:hypothetical protein